MTNKGKRILAAMLAALITVSGAGMAVVSAAEAAPAAETVTEEIAAATVTDSGMTYEPAADGTLTLVKYDGEAAVVVIPETVDGAKVTAVDGGAFAGCDKVEEITLPKTVTVLEAGVFDDCKKLKKLTLQNNAPEADGVTLDTDTEIIVLGKQTKGYDAAPWSGCTVLFAHDLTKAVVEKIPEQAYTGAAVQPALTVTDALGNELESGKDYTVAYKENVNAGTAVAAIAGMGDYFGEAEQTFAITAKDGTEQFRVEGVENKAYTGEAVTQSVTVYDGDKLLEENVDYTVSYERNTNVGTAAIVITGTGNYSGVVKKEFSIAKPFSAEAEISGLEDRVYNGAAQTQTITVKDGSTTLRENVDYTVAYANNTDAGTATVTVTGMGKYMGTLTDAFTIAPVDIADVKITPSNHVYTGAPITPDMVVSYNGMGLIIGGDYTITYKNNVNIGKATAVITMMGNYTGQKTVTFQITPEEVTGVKATATTSSVKLTWNATPQATGYRIFYWSNEKNNWVLLKDQSGTSYTHSGLPSGTTYKYAVKAYKKVSGTKYSGTYPTLSAATLPAKLTGLKVSKATDNTLTLKWNAVSGADAYQVFRWDAAKNGWKQIGNVTELTFTDKNLAAGTEYKYAVRGYKRVDGVLYRGAYPSLTVATAPAKVTGLKTSSTDKAVTLTWDTMNGATGYRIFYWSSEKNNWVLLKDQSGTSYTHGNLPSGTEYKYAVKAYKKVSGTKYSDTYPTIITATNPAKLTNLSAKTTVNSVALTWNSVSGADKYEVFRWNPERSKYLKIDETTECTYTDKDLSAASEYRYRVRAAKTVDGKTYLGGYPTLITATVPEKLTGLQASKATTGTVTLTWDAVPGATGYRVFRWDPSKNNWTLMKDISGGDVTSYKAVGLAENTEYKFAAKAYKKVDGVKYSGAYPTVTAKTKARVLLSVPYLNQNAWPTGCEATSTTMVLRYYGVPASIKQVVNAMPKGNLYYYQGRLYGPHPDEAFIGSPSSYSGYGCYAGTIEYTMESLLPEGKAAKAVRGLSMSKVEKYLDNGQPVIFWASMYMGSTYKTSSWYVTGTNKTYTWTANEHCLVLVGYDDNYYYFNDPMQPNNNGGLVKWEKSLVERRYNELGKQIVVVEDVIMEEPEVPSEEPTDPPVETPSEDKEQTETA